MEIWKANSDYLAVLFHFAHLPLASYHSRLFSSEENQPRRHHGISAAPTPPGFLELCAIAALLFFPTPTRKMGFTPAERRGAACSVPALGKGQIQGCCHSV